MHQSHIIISVTPWGFTHFQSRGVKDMGLDASSMEKRFAYKFLKKILKYVDSAQELIVHLGKYHYEISEKCVLLIIPEGIRYSFYEERCFHTVAVHDSLKHMV